MKQCIPNFFSGKFQSFTVNVREKRQTPWRTLLNNAETLHEGEESCLLLNVGCFYWLFLQEEEEEKREKWRNVQHTSPELSPQGQHISIHESQWQCPTLNVAEWQWYFTLFLFSQAHNSSEIIFKKN